MPSRPSKFWQAVILRMMALATLSFLNGCSHPQDADVTLSPEYNFSSFAGTLWKTKVKVALADVERYTGEHQLDLLAPRRFDPTVTNYASMGDAAKIIAILPAGTVLRVERFTTHNGMASYHEVKARLQNGTYSQKIVNIDPLLLAKNRFLWPSESSSTNWDVNPDLLEKP